MRSRASRVWRSGGSHASRFVAGGAGGDKLQLCGLQGRGTQAGVDQLEFCEEVLIPEPSCSQGASVPIEPIVSLPFGYWILGYAALDWLRPAAGVQGRFGGSRERRQQPRWGFGQGEPVQDLVRAVRSAWWGDDIAAFPAHVETG